MRLCNLIQAAYKITQTPYFKVKLSLGVAGIFSGIYFSSKDRNLLKIPNNSIKDKPTLLQVVMAEQDSKPSISKTMTMNFVADAVEIAAPAVVHIDVVSQPSLYHQTNSSGSGFIVSESGIVLTNAHVVGSSSQVNVRLSTGKTYKGHVIDIEHETDLVAIKLENKASKKFPFLKLGTTTKVRAGEFVAALGSPLRLSNTVTAGIVSSLQRGSGELGMRKGMYYIQTDAAINVGNSGGPLINLDGEVIGINCITVQQAAGISFAIPADIVSEFLDGALKREKEYEKNGGSFRKAKRNEKFYIGENNSYKDGGITMLTLSPEIVDELQQRNPSWFGHSESGVLVTKVNRGSPSEKCGLNAGDVILSINNKLVKSTRDVYNEVRKGDVMLMKVQRGSKTVTIHCEPEISSRL